MSLPPRLTELIQRDLGATRVTLVAPGDDEPSAASDALSVALPRGYTLHVELADPTTDRDALQRRLETIVSSFWESLAEALPPMPRPAVSDALHAEMRALVEAAGAANGIVIDAMSKVTWVEAAATEATPHVEQSIAEVIPFDPVARRKTPAPVHVPSPTERAVAAVRALPAMAGLSKGSPLAHHEREGDTPYVARSFATIYMLVLVFDAPFDELRAERELQARLEVIERLVVALPPLDPTPLTDAKAMRQRRT